MRHTTGWRCERLVGLVIASALLVAGCEKKSKDVAPDNSTPAAAGPTARQAVDAHLIALGQGTVTPNQLTSTFRDSLSRPKGDAEADARDFLAKFKDARFSILEETTFGNAIVVRGRAESPDRKDAFTLRMVKEGDEYKTDWLHRSEHMSMNFKEPADPDLAAAQDAVRNFVDIIFGGDVRRAHALMTPAWKTKLAGPNPADLRDGYDHSPGFLTQTTRTWKGDTLSYSLVKAELNAAKDEATIRVLLETRTSKVPFVLKASKLGGQWLVAAFDHRP